MYSIEAPVLENRLFPGNNCILTVEAPLLAGTVKAGQFLMAAPSGQVEIPAPLLKRALAVFTVIPRDGNPSALTLVIKAVGEGTRKLIDLRPGQNLDIVGPLGNGFDLERGRNKINIIVVGGTGVASVHILARELARRGEEVELAYGARTQDDLIGLPELEQLSIPIVLATEDGSAGHHGLVTEALLKRLDQVPEEYVNFFTCGPNAMMQAVSSIARERNIPCQISVEVKMGCGFGVCLGCTVKTTDGFRLACKDGPVFDAEEFCWEESPKREVAK